MRDSLRIVAPAWNVECRGMSVPVSVEGIAASYLRSCLVDPFCIR